MVLNLYMVCLNEMNSRQLKILQLRSSVGFFGAENVVIELSRAFNKVNVESVVGVIQNSNMQSLHLAQVAKDLALPNVLFPGTSKFNLSTLVSIIQYLKKNNIQIIQPHGYKANVYAYFARLFTHIPVIATCHPWTETTYSRRAVIYKWIDLLALRHFEKLVAVSKDIQVELGKIKSKEVHYISNGIDINKFQNENNGKLKRAFQIDKKTVIIGTVGRLVKEKGFIYLMEAASKLGGKDANFIILFIGDGPLRQSLEASAKNLNIDHCIRFLGNREDIPKLLAIIDIFVLPSISEGTPMALLEAMAAGKTIVATKVGDIPRIIINRKNGLTVPPANSTALAEAIYYLISNQTLAFKLGSYAKEFVARYYSSNRMADEYLKLYENILQASMT
jgi:glycosyltransferase involved in cell wall biosynthesis